jgi:hypothetical protein
MKLYKLYLAKPLLIFYMLIFGVWTVVPAILIIVGAIWNLGSGAPPIWIFLIWLCFGCFLSYMWLRIPFEIRVRDDSKIEFRSLFRTTVVSPPDIMSVRAKRYSIGLVDVAHTRGTVHLLNQMDGFHDFIATVKSNNPAVEIKGC